MAEVGGGAVPKKSECVGAPADRKEEAMLSLTAAACAMLGTDTDTDVVDADTLLAAEAATAAAAAAKLAAPMLPCRKSGTPENERKLEASLSAAN
jgi:hypothetical protein